MFADLSVSIIGSHSSLNIIDVDIGNLLPGLRDFLLVFGREWTNLYNMMMKAEAIIMRHSIQSIKFKLGFHCQTQRTSCWLFSRHWMFYLQLLFQNTSL